MSGQSNRGWPSLPAAALIALAAAVSGCGSNAASAPAAQPSPRAATPTDVARAQAVIQPYLSPPRQLTLTTPVTSRPPAGKTLVWLQCETPQCKEISTALGSAVAAVDWNLRVVDYQSANPATLIAGMQQALQYRPVAVVLNGSPYAVWKGEVPAYAKAGVPLIVGSVGPVPINRTIVANIVGPPDISLAARILADWFIATSAAQGKALLYSVPDFPAIALIQTAFQQAVAQDCSGCSVTLLSQTIPQVASGELNPAVVSALQRSPAIRYVILPDYPLTSGLPEALSAAGIRGIKIAGIYAGRTDQELIRQGQEAAGTPQEINLSSWLTVDAAIRHLEGMPIATGDGGLPEQLLTQSTVGTPSDTYNYPANYQQLFRHLWRVG